MIPVVMAEQTTNEEAMIKIKVAMEWDDADNQDGRRPDSVEVQLIANEEICEGTKKILKDSNNWSAFWEVRAYDDNKEIEYVVDCMSIEGYDCHRTGNMRNGYTIKGCHEPETVDVSVMVAWDDEENTYSLRPDTVLIQLFANDKEVNSADLSAKNEWKHSFSNIPKYNKGEEIIYQVGEEGIEQYTTAITGDGKDGIVITNSLHMPRYTVTYDLAGGSSETVQLIHSGLKSGTVTPRVTEPTKEGWSFTGWQPEVADTVTADVTYVAQWEEIVPENKAVSVVKRVDRNLASVGDILTYTISVINTGNVALENIIVTDAFLGKVDTCSLDIGGSTSFTYNYTVTGRDEGTALVNAAVAMVDGVIMGEASCSTQIAARPVTKYTVVYDLAGGSSEGVQLVYHDLESNMDTPRIAEPTKEGWTFTGWEPKIADTVTADATYVAQWEEIVPEIKAVSVVKRVDRNLASVGDILTYTITVMNIGNVDLDNIVLTDEWLGKNEAIPRLGVGENASFIYTYTVTYRDGGTTLVNTATVEQDGTFLGEDTCSTQIAVWQEPVYIPTVQPQLNREEHMAYIIGRPDGKIHPKDSITRAEVATIFFRLLTKESRQEYESWENDYVDVDRKAWYNHAVSTLTNAGIFTGRPGNRFDPEDNITRGEFAALVVRFFRNENAQVMENRLNDVMGHWAQEDIDMAYTLGLITGYPDDSFRPNEEISRAEAVAVINRVLDRHPDKDYLLDDMFLWPDNMDRAVWYYADIQEATNSHTFIVKTDQDGTEYEVWKQLLQVPDWAQFEKSD